jgi:uncharacterized protein YecE (DUF72 family)
VVSAYQIQARVERQARREARREKQRTQNPLRARKMHALRIQAVIPEKPARPLANPRRFIGCSGWFYWHWRGKFYPESLPTKAWFDHYSDRFDTVELNAPFYSWPTAATVSSWIQQLHGRKFVYTVKVCELITHVKRFRGTKELIRDFGYVADLLGEHMGCLLFQLPPSFHYTRARLRNIVEQLDPQRRNVVEFRHASWWNEDVYKVFRDRKIIFCSCSGPKLPDTLVKTSNEIYMRFHGKSAWYRHNYTHEELKCWAERVRRIRPKRVWAYFNNDREAYAIENARQFQKLLT